MANANNPNYHIHRYRTTSSYVRNRSEMEDILSILGRLKVDNEQEQADIEHAKQLTITLATRAERAQKDAERALKQARRAARRLERMTRNDE